MERRRTLGSEVEKVGKQETYCYDLLYEEEVKTGNVIALNTGITYADLKKYARVSICQKMSVNNPVNNSVIKLGNKNIGRASASGIYILLDLRNDSMIEPWCMYENTSLIDPKYGTASPNYPIDLKRSAIDMEKATIKDTDEITFENITGEKLKVDTKFYIYGVSKYV